jgi:hypothetical protein
MSLLYIHRMLDDLTESEFGHQPVPGANSAAWIIGHLAVTVRRTAERLGATGLPDLPEEFVARYSVTHKPAGAQTELDTKAALVALFDECTGKLIPAISALPVEALANPPLSATGLATNYGEAVLFGVLHVAMHSGQLSTIRRSLGKPPVV